jgi:hypothetical protein
MSPEEKAPVSDRRPGQRLERSARPSEPVTGNQDDPEQTEPVPAGRENAAQQQPAQVGDQSSPQRSDRGQ